METATKQVVNGASLEELGEILDHRPASLNGDTVATALAENLLRVRSREGAIVPLTANAMQREFERRRGRRNIVLKARQLGMTTWAAGRFFLKTITRPGTLTLEVAHTQEAAEEIFRIVHRFLDWLPEELRTGPLATSRANARQLVFPELDSQYKVVTAGDRNAGRGLTVQNLHCSELARWPGDPGETLAGLRASLAPGAEVILESTPWGVGGCFYQEWHAADETGTVRHFFPWWMEEGYRGAAVEARTLTEEERKLRARAGLTLEQIGYRRQMKASLRRSWAQEFAEDAESCFLASGDCYFEMDAIEERIKDLQEPAERRRNGELEIWLPPLKGHEYLVALDPATGLSTGDYSAAQVMELETGMQCAEFQGHVGGRELAELVARLGQEYNQALVVVERNSIGAAALALLQEVCRYPRIYRQNGQAGWLTTVVTRPAALGRLNAALIQEPGRFLSRRLLAECRTFVRQADGNPGAASGAHDDLVMAMAMAFAVREGGGR
ncbi:MAG: terminase [Terracidiphilus sp.]